MLQAIMAKASAGSSYVGPGNIATFQNWWGLRGYTTAVANTGTQKSVRVRRASDSTEQDIVILTSGGLDLSSAASFAGTDTSGNATSSGTSVALTGLGSAAHVGSTISGAGFSADTYCVSVGALVAGAQTVTTNTSQTIGVSEPVTLTYALYVTTIYDQVGGNDVVQATTGRQPQLFLGAGPSSGLPYIGPAGGSVLGSNDALGVSQPHTWYFVGDRTGAFTSQQFVMSSTTNFIITGYANAADLYESYAGADMQVTASDSAWHMLLTIFNGASSTAQVDATTTSGNLSTAIVANQFFLFARDNSSLDHPFTGKFQESGISTGAMSSGNRTSLNSQIHAYGGF